MSNSVHSDPWIGRLIGNPERYRLEHTLGGGGMGDVYKAMDLRLGQEVALKLLKAGLADNDDLRRRFEREIVVSAALLHEHIVQVKDHGVTEEGYPFFVMEYLKGASLGQVLRCERRLTVDRAINIISQVCDGLHMAHSGITLWREGATTAEYIKVVHRDLKPDNIFLIPHSRLSELVKILDFGIAKIRNDQLTQTNLTSMGSFLGTCRYAAPEQWRGDEDIDGRADIYSLGIMLYEMLSGTDPFGLRSDSRGINPTSWLTAHAFTDPHPIRQLPDCHMIPVDLEQLTLKCLAKDPNDRFTSVEELSQALQQADIAIPSRPLNTAPTQANRYNPTTPTPQVQSAAENPPTVELPVTPPSATLSDYTQPQSGNQTTPLSPPPSASSTTPLEPTIPKASLPQSAQMDPTAAIPTTAPSSDPTAAMPAQSPGPKPATAAPPPDPTAPLPKPATTPAVAGTSTPVPTQPLPSALTHESGSSTPPTRRPRQSRLWLWPAIGGLGATAALVVAGIILWSRPSPLDEAQAMVAQGDLTTGIVLASQVVPQDPDYPLAQTLIARWRLDNARAAANGGDFAAAISEAEQIPSDQETYSTAQILIAEWNLDRGLALIEDGSFTRAETALRLIPADQPIFERADQLLSDIENWEKTTQAANAGDITNSLVYAYEINPSGALGNEANDYVCDSLAKLVDQRYRELVDASFDDPSRAPIFEGYQFSDCLTESLKLETQIVNLDDRGDDNLKVMTVIMMGFAWENLPEKARERMGKGDVFVEFMERDQAVAQVTLTAPEQLGLGEDALDLILPTMRVQRPNS